MGGGVSRKNRNIARNKSRRDWTDSLFSSEPSIEYSTAEQGSSSPYDKFASNSNYSLPAREIDQDEATMYSLTLFIAMYYILKGKFGNEKNKKLIEFLHKVDKTIINKKESLINSSEFIKFQDYCKNKNIHQYSGYEIVRRFMTKYFSDASGIFMRLSRDEWIRFVSRFLIFN
ncbi:MAG: hypothetical protein FWG77_04735 [Treponema sp.]|nr:hypothetical protein [Treponema sp.]